MTIERNHNSECVRKFRRLIDTLSYHHYVEDGKVLPLWNLTFFLGAGFSYAWDKRYPLGTKLFEIDLDDIVYHHRDEYEYLLAFCKYCGFFKSLISYDIYVSIYYRLQMMRRHDFLQGRFWDKFGLERVEEEFRLYFVRKLKKMTEYQYVDKEQKFAYLKRNTCFYTFFDRILSELTGDSGVPEGIRTNFLTTNYDNIIERIIDYHISDILPYYYYSYRGFTPNYANGSKQCVCPHDNQLVFPLLKLNGGIEIFKDADTFSLDYRNEELSKFKNCAPEVIFPCQEQGYDTDYFKTIFPKANRILQETNVLVVIGYAFPKEDGLIRFLLKQFAESLRDAEDKIIFYIDYDRYGRENELKDRVLQIFPELKNRLFVYTKGFASFAKSFNKLKAAYEI